VQGKVNHKWPTVNIGCYDGGEERLSVHTASHFTKSKHNSTNLKHTTSLIRLMCMNAYYRVYTLLETQLLL